MKETRVLKIEQSLGVEQTHYISLCTTLVGIYGVLENTN